MPGQIADMEIRFWATFVAAFGVCAVSLPFIRALAARSQLFDSSGPLKIHTAPIPRLGGIAITLGLMTVFITARQLGKPLLAFVVSLLVLWLTGLIDDLRSLSPAIRLVAQLASALLLCQAAWPPLLPGPRLLNLAIGALFVGVFVNAFNFLDGADGVAAGVALVIAAAYIVTGTGQPSRPGSLLAWGLAGSCLGFLLFNFPPATIFMGDSGSTVLGFTVAYLSMDFYNTTVPPARNLLVPLVFAGLPLLDFFLAVLRRWRKRASPFLGDRQHFYDLLLQRGWSPRQVALSCAGFTVLFGIAGWVWMKGEGILAMAAAPLAVGLLLIASIRLGSLRHSPDVGGLS